MKQKEEKDGKAEEEMEVETNKYEETEKTL